MSIQSSQASNQRGGIYLPFAKRSRVTERVYHDPFKPCLIQKQRAPGFGFIYTTCSSGEGQNRNVMLYVCNPAINLLILSCV